MHPFEAEIRGALAAEGGLGAGCRLLVACSGGADSVALLAATAALAPAAGWRLAVAHLDHGLRADSAADAALVRALAAERGLPCYSERVAVAALPSSRGRSPEDAAREARRAFLMRTATEGGAAAVLLGHTADDQAETVLLNLMRGAGTRGLGGMARRQGLFLRPMLELAHADVLAYLTDRGLRWREDASNRDRAFTRNWVRREVLPALAAAVPNVSRNLLAAAADARTRTAAAQAQLDELLPPLLRVEVGRITAATAFPDILPEALRGDAVREIYRRLTGTLAALERRHVAAVLALAPGETLALPAGVSARRGNEWVFTRAAAPAPALTAWQSRLLVPGATRVTPVGVEITATRGPAPAALAGLGWAEVWLREDLGELTVRGRRAGDRIRPVGLAGTKKLQDLFVDAKVPAAARPGWPVVCAGDSIVWVPGLALAAGASARPSAPALHLIYHGRPLAERAGFFERATYGLRG